MGLQVLHALNILHRDLKPANVLLTRDPAAPWAADCGGLVPKLADFGESKVLADEATAKSRLTVTLMRGTLAFMAPEAPPSRSLFLQSHVPREVFVSKKYGLSADVFSLGITIWVVLLRKTNPCDLVSP